MNVLLGVMKLSLFELGARRTESRTPQGPAPRGSRSSSAALCASVRQHADQRRRPDLGLRGDLTISDAMENLMDALFFEKIPPCATDAGPTDSQLTLN